MPMFHGKNRTRNERKKKSKTQINNSEELTWKVAELNSKEINEQPTLFI
jgi:hypothetical protein